MFGQSFSPPINTVLLTSTYVALAIWGISIVVLSSIPRLRRRMYRAAVAFMLATVSIVSVSSYDILFGMSAGVFWLLSALGTAFTISVALALALARAAKRRRRFSPEQIDRIIEKQMSWRDSFRLRPGWWSPWVEQRPSGVVGAPGGAPVREPHGGPGSEVGR